jgi:hypothetical protein
MKRGRPRVINPDHTDAHIVLARTTFELLRLQARRNQRSISGEARAIIEAYFELRQG